MAYLHLAVGIVLLVLGGEGVVRGCITIARRLQVSTLLIGLTIAAYGTSAPELVVSIDAALRGATGIAVGNVVGSNIANILLILAVAALIRPIQSTPEALRRDGAAVVLATLLLVLVLLTGGVALPQALFLVAVLVGIVLYTYRTESRLHDAGARLHEAEAQAIDAAPIGPFAATVFLLAGLGLLVYGANLFVGGAVAIARDFGIDEAVIGLTLVALGTSLPELFTAGIASWRGQSDLALGNIMGSNVFNVVGILGLTGLVVPLPTPVGLELVDLGMVVLSTVLLLVFVATGLRLVRWEALVLLAAYLGYVAFKLNRL